MTDKTTERLKETVASAIRERDRLKAENDKLRNEVGNLMDFEHLTSVAVAYAGCDECGEYKQTMLRLFAENAKLRELMLEMYATISDRNTWWDCMSNDARRFADRMRELGVEVQP